jgi:SAM-dependent methyltransferase
MSLADRLYYFYEYRWARSALWENAVPTKEVLQQVLAGRAPGRAIDLGAGTGRNASYLAEQGWEVLGIDLYPVAVRRAQRRIAERGLANRARFEVRNALDLSGLGPFDLALDLLGPATDLLPARRADYARALSEILAPGGLLLIFSPLPRRAWLDLERHLAPVVLDPSRAETPAGRWSIYRR